jgi:carbonic anhydrase/acetyltransferase-like protein (isoleucine patch superfamily)
MTAIILPFRGLLPHIDPSAFVAPGAVIIGDVEIGPEASIWFGCVLRGDVGPIRIGSRTNIQDGCVLHVTEGGQGTHVGDGVTVGHMCLLHDCRAESGAFIGMRAVMMDGSSVETGGMLAAGSVLTQGKRVQKGHIWAGNPAQCWREVRSGEHETFAARAGEYVDLARQYRLS